MTLYKLLLPGRLTPYQHTRWPVRARTWTQAVEDPTLCLRGWHLATELGLSQHLFAGVLWTAEGRGVGDMAADKVAYTSARLLAKVGDVAKPALVSLALDFAEHVLPLFEACYPTDPRPREAIETGRRCLVEKAFFVGMQTANAAARAAANAAANSAAYATRAAAAAYAAAKSAAAACASACAAAADANANATRAAANAACAAANSADAAAYAADAVTNAAAAAYAADAVTNAAANSADAAAANAYATRAAANARAAAAATAAAAKSAAYAAANAYATRAAYAAHDAANSAAVRAATQSVAERQWQHDRIIEVIGA